MSFDEHPAVINARMQASDLEQVIDLVMARKYTPETKRRLVCAIRAGIAALNNYQPSVDPSLGERGE